MTGTGNNSQTEFEDELEALLERAVKAIRAEPSPKDARQRVIDAAASWTPDSVKERSRRRMKLLAAVAVAAALLAAVFVGLSLTGIISDTRETASTDRARTDEDDGPASQHRETLAASRKKEVTKNRGYRAAPYRDKTFEYVPAPTDQHLSYQMNQESDGVDPSYLMTVVAESAPIMLANGRGETIELGAWMPGLKAGEGAVHVWDWSRSPRSRVLKDVELLTVHAALSPRGKWLLKTNGDLFDLETGERRTIDLGAGVRIGGRWGEGVNDVQFSPDDGRLAVLIGSRTDEGARRGEVWILEFPSGKRLCEFPASEPFALRIGFSPDGKQVVTGGPVSYVLPRIGFSPDGKQVVTDAPFRHILRRDTTTGEIIKLYEPALDEQIYSTAISPDGRFVAATQFEGDLLVWEADTGRLAHIQDRRGESIGAGCLRFSPDGGLLAAADWRRITVYDAATGRVVREIEREAIPGPTVVQWSADGKDLTVVRAVPAGTMDGRDIYPSVHVWDWRSGRLLRSLDASAPSARGRLGPSSGDGAG
ncbi:MAG: WD40 repeat domain-containing protein [Planctomycetota bacterium]|jgi:WD40 repeat protein